MGGPAGAALVEDRAHRVEIRAVVHVRVPTRLFGRHVRRRPEHGARPRELGGRPRDVAGHHARDAEVEHLDDLLVLVVRQEDVVGLEVAVDDAAGVHRGEGAKERDAHPHDLLDGQPVEPLHTLGEGLARQVLHDEVRATGRILVVVQHVDDAAARHRRRGPRFLVEATQDVRVGGQARQEHLDRHATAHGDVHGLEDRSHAADPEHALEPVPPAELQPHESPGPLLAVRVHEGRV